MLTEHPEWVAMRLTFSFDVSESTITSIGKSPFEMAFFARMTGCGQDSPRASMVSDAMKYLLYLLFSLMKRPMAMTRTRPAMTAH